MPVSIRQLSKVKDILSKKINKQEFINKLHAIQTFFNGDGSGLTSGVIIDKYICEYFSEALECFEEYHKGECDLKIGNIPLSLKKIKGKKSSIALNWSRNENEGRTSQDFFNAHIILIVLNSDQWWKTKPKKADNEIVYNNIVNSGIYLIDKDYCKSNIKLKKNNKSNSVIDSTNLYKMIDNCVKNDLYIRLPEKNKDLKYSIMKGFNN